MVKLDPAKKNELMQQIEIGHGEKAIFLFETFSEVGRAGESGIKCYLRNIIVLFFHQVLCFFQPEFF